MSVLLWDQREAVPEHEGRCPKVSDEELVRRFATARSDEAFEELVLRHGPVVIAVCRRVLGSEQDAEDAFQATFLVFARKAASLRRAGSVAAWLHKTAYRIALRARAANARRRERTLEAEAMIASETLSHITSDHDQSVLDEELNRMPEKYRLPLYLCCIEGMSRDEAAERIQCSPGSLKGLLERGRRLLRQRLMLRRVSLGVALAAIAQSQQTAQAAVAPSLVAATVQAGVQYAAGQGVLGYVSHNALSLAKGSSAVMSLTTSKIIACSLVTVGLVAWGAGHLPVPAVAGSSEVVLETGSTKSVAMEMLVAFLADGEREEPRRDAGREREGAESPEARLERRSPERDLQRRESEAGRHRRDGEGEREREAFRPQTDREAALYRMILNLQREVAQLRRELQSRDTRHEGRDSRTNEEKAHRDQRNPEYAQRRELANLEKIYHTYDKDRNGRVSFDEFLSMREGADNPEVRNHAEELFKQVDLNGDGHVSFQEFRAARNRRAEGDRPREGERARKGDRLGDREHHREGERAREGDPPREEGDRPRDRERERDGDRLGDREHHREGERAREDDRPREEADRPHEGERERDGDRPRDGEFELER